MPKSYLEWFAELGPLMHPMQKRLAKKGQAGLDLVQAVIDDVPFRQPMILVSKKDGDVKEIIGGVIVEDWLYVWFQCHNTNFHEMVFYDIVSDNGGVTKLKGSFNNCTPPYLGIGGSVIMVSQWYGGLRWGFFIHRGEIIAEIMYQEKPNRYVLVDPCHPSPTPESSAKASENLKKFFPEKEVKKILACHAASDTVKGKGWEKFSHKEGCLKIKHLESEYRVYLRNGSLYLVY